MFEFLSSAVDVASSFFGLTPPAAPPPPRPAAPAPQPASPDGAAASSAFQLYNAFSGAGTDEDAVRATLSSQSPAGLDEVRSAYRGQTGGNLLRIAVGGHMAVDMPIHDAERAWSSALERYFVKRVA